MNREEFMRQLKELLSDISKEERDEALRFYESYFEDAGERNEQKILKELESPQKVADTIKSGLGAAEGNTKDDGRNRSGTRDPENNTPQSRKHYTSFKGTKTGRNAYGQQHEEHGQYEKDPFVKAEEGYAAYSGEGGQQRKQKLPSWALVLIVVAVCVAGVIVSFMLIFVAFGLRFAGNIGKLVKNQIVEEYVTDSPGWIWNNDYNYDDDDDYDYDYDDYDDAETHHDGHHVSEYAAGGNGVISYSNDAGTTHIQLDPSGWKEMEFELKSGELEFVHSGDEYIYIDISGKYADMINCYLDGSEFYIEDERSKQQAFGSGNVATVEVAVPEGYQFGDLYIDINAAEIKSGIALEAKNIDIEVGAGVIKLDTVNAQSDLLLNAGAGEIVIKDGSCKFLEAECGVGNLEMTGEVKKDIDITCGIGNVELYVPGVQNPYNYEVKCGAGNVTVGGRSYAGIGSIQSVDNGGNRELYVDCGVGNVLVKFTDQ